MDRATTWWLSSMTLRSLPPYDCWEGHWLMNYELLVSKHGMSSLLTIGLISFRWSRFHDEDSTLAQCNLLCWRSWADTGLCPAAFVARCWLDRSPPVYVDTIKAASWSSESGKFCSAAPI